MTLSKVGRWLLLALCSRAILWLTRRIYAYRTSPLRFLPGPSRKGLKLGDVAGYMDAWRAQYGPTFRYPGVLWTHRLYTSDLTAVRHILTNTEVYHRPHLRVKGMRNGPLGRGLLTTEGEEHRNLRKIMGPAFAAPQIRALCDIFLQKSMKLRDNWIEDVNEGTGEVEVLAGLRNMALDTITLAGFNYESNALEKNIPDSELALAFGKFFHSPLTHVARLLEMLQLLFPPFLLIPIAANRASQRARRSISDIGYRLLRESKEALSTGGAYEVGKVSQRKDLLSLLVKSNMTTDENTAPLSDEIVVAQLPAFFVAGHETTSTATAWTLYELAKCPEYQARLRKELSGVPTASPTADQLAASSLPFLDLVIREALRLHDPVTFVSREAVKDDVLPLGGGARGVGGSIPIPKGQIIYIPISGVNRDPAIWGPDAEVYRPERWEDSDGSLPDAVKRIPGVRYAAAHGILSFLGGAHGCIGVGFAVLEIKALIFTLLRTFAFELAVPPEDVGTTLGFFGHPYVKSRRDEGTRMPLKLRVLEGV